MLEANDMVEAKLAEIRERKIYEMKRMFAAKMHEGVGGLTNAEIEARKKAGYKKASDVLGDPRKETKTIEGHSFKKVGKVKPPKQRSVFDIDMSKEKKISEDTIDEDTMANAARIMDTLRSRGIKGNISRASLKRLRKSKSSYDPLKQAEKFAKNKPEQSEPEKETSTYKRPGMLKRNINTLMGHEPGHVDTRTPEEKLYSKGGRGGKAARTIGKAGLRAVGRLARDLTDIGTSNLR